jgi:competence protein ComGC
MTNHSSLLTKHRDGWTLIVLLIVVAIIALLMIIYLPTVLQSYSPPTTTDEEGTTKPVLKHVEDQLAPIDSRSQPLEDYLPEKSPPQDDQPEGSDQ